MLLRRSGNDRGAKFGSFDLLLHSMGNIRRTLRIALGSSPTIRDNGRLIIRGRAIALQQSCALDVESS